MWNLDNYAVALSALKVLRCMQMYLTPIKLFYVNIVCLVTIKKHIYSYPGISCLIFQLKGNVCQNQSVDSSVEIQFLLLHKLCFLVTQSVVVVHQLSCLVSPLARIMDQVSCNNVVIETQLPFLKPKMVSRDNRGCPQLQRVTRVIIFLEKQLVLTFFCHRK